MTRNTLVLKISFGVGVCIGTKSGASMNLLIHAITHDHFS